MKELIRALESLTARPTLRSDEYKLWIEQSDFIRFLSLIDTLDEVVLYAAASHLFLHSVIAPTELVSPPDKEDIDGWSYNPYSSWGITTVSSEGEDDAYIAPPLENSCSRTIMHGEQLIFARSFDGRQEENSYIECSQRLTHSFNLHYVPERSAYCRFDMRGDVEDVIRIVDFPDTDRGTAQVVTIPRDIIDEYMTLTDQSLILMFDSTRFTPSSFGGWADNAPEYHNLSDDTFYRISTNPRIASYIRGAAIIRSRLNTSDVMSRQGFGFSVDREYASFIAFDWKHDEIHDCSSNPAMLGNYFVKSDLPFSTSPVFFRADVLQKYKADADKYLIRDRSITCRNAYVSISLIISWS